MSDTRKVWRIEVRRTVSAHAYVLANTADEAREMARQDASELLRDGDEDDDFPYASEATDKTTREHIWNDGDDGRTVAEFFAGVKPHAETAREAAERWRAGKPNIGPVEHGAWLCDGPDIGANGPIVFSAWAALRVHGADFGERNGYVMKLETLEQVMKPTAQHVPVVAGPDASVGTEGHVKTGPTFGAAAVDRELIETWLPGPWTEALATGPLDAVHFRGDGWDAVIMPFRRD